MRPPPYERGAELKKIYPQLPVTSQEGNYLIKDKDERILETGKAETTIKMYPNSKSEKKRAHLEMKGKLRNKRMEFGDDDDDDDQSDLEEFMGGYDPAVRRILARAERRRGATGEKKDLRDDSSSESVNGDSDGNWEREGLFIFRRAFLSDIQY